MGIENRDYFRDDKQTSYTGYGGADQSSRPIWQKLLLITVAAFVVQLLFREITGWFSLIPTEVFRGQIWRVLTYAFLHDRLDLFHILFNMLLLYFFGRRLESMYGGNEFGLFYCMSAIFAGLCFLAFGLYFHDLTPFVGASSAVMAVVVLYAIHFPEEQIWLMGLLPLKVKFLAGFIVIMDLYPVLLHLGGDQSEDRIAHTAHLGGAVFAWLYYRNRWKLSRWLPGSATITSTFPSFRKSKLKIYREERELVSAEEVDRILLKIQNHGEASLTAQERKTLIKASEQYKQK